MHLAAFKIPRYGKALDTLQINYRGTECALEFARKLGCKCVLASTSDVYGRNPAIPFSEENYRLGYRVFKGAAMGIRGVEAVR